jgi:hypothetical protein
MTQQVGGGFGEVWTVPSDTPLDTATPRIVGEKMRRYLDEAERRLLHCGTARRSSFTEAVLDD